MSLFLHVYVHIHIYLDYNNFRVMVLHPLACNLHVRVYQVTDDTAPN